MKHLFGCSHLSCFALENHHVPVGGKEIIMDIIQPALCRCCCWPYLICKKGWKFDCERRLSISCAGKFDLWAIEMLLPKAR